MSKGRGSAVYTSDKAHNLVKEISEEMNLQIIDLMDLIVNQWVQDGGYEQLKEVREAWETLREQNPAVIELLNRAQ